MLTTLPCLQALVARELKAFAKPDRLLLVTTHDRGDLLETSEGKAKKPFEYFQVFDQNDQPVVIDGQDVVLYRHECHGPNRIRNLYHRGTSAFIVNAHNELLVPIRAADKDLFPSMGDVSVSEHVAVRESYFDATLRGFREEQGTDIDPSQLQFIMKVPIIDSEQSEMYEYYVFFDKGGRRYQISSETASQRWVPISTLKGANIVQILNFRPYNLPALERLIARYDL